jgi:hypothetical protein
LAAVPVVFHSGIMELVMRISLLPRAARWISPAAVAALAIALASSAGPAPAAPNPAADAVAFFFPVEGGAKDCVFDTQRQRVYVTNDKQLVVLDAKERKTVKSIALPGKVRACDITPDCKHLAIAPFTGQFLYWVNLDDLEVTQVKFKAGGSETGVFDLCVGVDGSVLFTMVFMNSEGAASGWVKLRRFDPETSAVTEVASALGVGVRMSTIVSASGDRRFAVVGEGNSSPGPVSMYDFREQKLKHVTATNGFIYEIATSADGSRIARPHGKGCEIFDAKGGRLGDLEGKAVVSAAFHPKADRLFVLRDGETGLQEYTVANQKLVNEYPLEKAVKITGDVNDRLIANLRPVGRDMVIAHIRRARSVTYKSFEAGRVRVSDDGEKVLVSVPAGVYVFATKKVSATDEAPKFKVIEAKE